MTDLEQIYEKFSTEKRDLEADKRRIDERLAQVSDALDKLTQAIQAVARLGADVPAITNYATPAFSFSSPEPKPRDLALRFIHETGGCSYRDIAEEVFGDTDEKSMKRAYNLIYELKKARSVVISNSGGKATVMPSTSCQE